MIRTAGKTKRNGGDESFAFALMAERALHKAVCGMVEDYKRTGDRLVMWDWKKNRIAYIDPRKVTVHDLPDRRI